MESKAYILGQFDQLRIAKDFYGKLCLVDDDLTLPAIFQVCLDFAPQRGIEVPIDIVRDFPDYCLAIQCDPSLRKERSSFWRSLSLARRSLDFTAASEIPTEEAVSSVDKPSMSRSTKTILKSGES